MHPRFFCRYFLALHLAMRALAVASSGSVTPPTETEELATWHLQPGETRTLQIKDLERFSISGTAVRLAPMPEPSPAGSLLIKGVQVGRSEIWVWRRDQPLLHWNIQVQTGRREENPPAAGSLDSGLSGLREARVFRAGDRATLRGMIQTEAELSRIQVLEEAFGKQIENQTELSPGLLESGRSRVSTWIETQKLQGLLRIETLGGHLWVRGSAPDQATLGSWRKTLRSTFPATQIELSTLPDSSRTLFFRVFFLEMKKSALRQLGLQWPSHLSGSLLLEGGSLFWSQPPSVELSLQWLEGKGWAKVLSRPELVVRVPGEAELFNGGEIPLEIRSRAGNRAGAWIEWKPYGLTLKLKTLFCTADQVRFEVSSEISELDRANGTATLPALQASRVKSQIDARIGEPIFLSGLLQEKTGSQTQGWPGLSQIPLLGKLFGSEDFVHQRSELVAVILPLNAPPPAVGMRSESELALGMKPELALGLKPEPAPVSAHRFSTGFDPALRPLLERARP